jgi:rare lipoprotein A
VVYFNSARVFPLDVDAPAISSPDRFIIHAGPRSPLAAHHEETCDRSMMSRFAALLLLLSALLPLPAEARTEDGWGSRYSRQLIGRRMANGEVLNHSVLAVAHKTLPLGSRVSVVNAENGRVHEGVVMDRGPFTPRLIIDASPALADKLGMSRSRPTRIRLTVLSRPTRSRPARSRSSPR